MTDQPNVNAEYFRHVYPEQWLADAGERAGEVELGEEHGGSVAVEVREQLVSAGLLAAGAAVFPDAGRGGALAR